VSGGKRDREEEEGEENEAVGFFPFLERKK
jgi:hypothetical protein